MKVFTAVLSIAAILLGGLWLLQGLGLVHLRPILCFANCEPVQGPSMTWVIIGAVVMIAGLLGVSRTFRRRT